MNSDRENKYRIKMEETFLFEFSVMSSENFEIEVGKGLVEGQFRLDQINQSFLFRLFINRPTISELEQKNSTNIKCKSSSKHLLEKQSL